MKTGVDRKPTHAGFASASPLTINSITLAHDRIDEELRIRSLEPTSA